MNASVPVHATGPAAEPAVPLLSVRDLHVRYPVRDGVVHAVDGVDLDVRRGEVVSLVGESGCGKSSVGRALVRLEPAAEGSIVLDGVDLAQLQGGRLRAARRRFQMVFQDPYTSLDPRRTIEEIVRAPLEIHGIGDRQQRYAAARAALDLVGLGEGFLERRPAALSGGQRQRVGIARAAVLQPQLLVCDEPISALDVSIQAQIIALLEELRARLGLTIVFIAHNLAVVRHLSDRVVVMYLGRFVESAPAGRIFARPLHPYTQALVSAAPIPNSVIERARRRIILPGDPPSPSDPPSGCRFRTRCVWAIDRCARESPPLRELEPGHLVACHRAEEVQEARTVAPLA